MTWIAGPEEDWHFVTVSGDKKYKVGCGMVLAEDHPNLFSGDEPPYFPVFDPQMPVCQGCKNYRTMNELAE